MTIIEFFNVHWMLAFWTLLFAIPVALSIVYTVRFLARSVLRTIKVALRGWPPSHLDADGDWQPRAKQGEL